MAKATIPTIAKGKNFNFLAIGLVDKYLRPDTIVFA
jgi:hypothetical protein